MDSSKCDEAEAFLRSFHAKHAGGSTRVFARGTDEHGVSSYQRLVRSVATTHRDVTVLDLGCGDGYLLGLLRESLGSEARLIGIDMSPDELGAARARLDSTVDLRCERAQTTTFASGSVDVVVSHMALMLMAPLDAVLREMHRILRPGGMLAAVVGSDRRPPGAWAEFIAIARELCALPTIAIGDPRARTVAGIRAVFGASTEWTEIAIDEFEVNIDGPWAQVEAHLFATYVSDLLAPALREPLRREAAVRIPALADTRGVIPCRLGMRLLQYRRADASATPAVPAMRN